MASRSKDPIASTIRTRFSNKIRVGTLILGLGAPSASLTWRGRTQTIDFGRGPVETGPRLHVLTRIYTGVRGFVRGTVYALFTQPATGAVA
mgnify:CR=1 FL=1